MVFKERMFINIDTKCHSISLSQTGMLINGFNSLQNLSTVIMPSSFLTLSSKFGRANDNNLFEYKIYNPALTN